MKRVLGILSVITLLCTLLMTGVVASATGSYQLDFSAQDMVYDSTNAVWSKAAGDMSCLNYPGYAVVDTAANGGAAAIRKFVAPTAGPLQLAWGNGVYIDNGQGNLTGATVQFAITDASGQILFPTNGDVATVTEGTPLAVNLTIDAVAAGDEFYFVIFNPSVDRLVCVMNFGVIVNGVAYSNGSGFLYDGTTQGGNGWYHQYAATVTKTTVDEALNKVVALNFTEQEMEYVSANGAWGVNGSVYETASWSNWGYVDQVKANIRKLVMPRAGTFKIEHIWGVSGVTVQDAAQSFDFAVLNKDKKIVWPTTGGMFHVTSTTPAAVDVTLDVAAGDAVYFVFTNGSNTPTAYTTHSIISLDDYTTRLDNASGGYGAADITAQGNGGWYYLYAADLTEVKAKDLHDLTALNAAIAEAEGYTDLSGYTDDSAAALTAALTAAKAITTANTQPEIDAATAALNAAIDGLTVKAPVTPPPAPPTLPAEDPADPTVALKFTEQLMTYENTLQAWRADEANDCVITPTLSFTPAQNAKVAIRKFVAPVAGDLIVAWGNGICIDRGQANFVITDKYGKIIYPENGGKIVLDAGTPHVLEKVFANVAAGDVFYFVAYNQTETTAVVTMHSAINLDGTAYAENGNLANSANTQGAGGWYYVYATDLVEVKASAYKNLIALNEQIASAKAIPETTLSLYATETVTAFRSALAAAEALSEANSQAEIDAATSALEAAIKALVPKATASNVNKVDITSATPMTFQSQTGYWTAADDAACILTEPLNYATPVTSSNTAVIRKLVLPQDGTLLLKWGNGVYIDNTSGNYTGATAEFAIADKDGNILYPKNGGVAKIVEGKSLELDLELPNLKKGDELYFITHNPSMANVPVVYNFGVTLNGATSLQTAGGSPYGTNEQGPVWYYLFAKNLTFTVSGAVNDTPGDTDNGDDGNDGATIPATGESDISWFIGMALVLSGAVLVFGKKRIKGGV
ncbi:MAG: LPXTG cell wall anchor domain-containing protein [Clostridia bacterium]|nr:LPXTG cell wall anchor domain-containing protein [Clostridia bacterium]